jgi:hypothetical protein
VSSTPDGCFRPKIRHASYLTIDMISSYNYIMTATDSNVQMSHDEGLENSFTVCSVVANIAAVLVDRQVRKVQGRRFRMRKRMSYVIKVLTAM